MESLKEIVGKYLDPEDPRYHKLLDELESRELEWQYREDNNCGVVYSPESLKIGKNLLSQMEYYLKDHDPNSSGYINYVRHKREILWKRFRGELRKLSTDTEYNSINNMAIISVYWEYLEGPEPFYKVKRMVDLTELRSRRDATCGDSPNNNK